MFLIESWVLHDWVEYINLQIDLSNLLLTDSISTNVWWYSKHHSLTRMAIARREYGSSSLFDLPCTSSVPLCSLILHPSSRCQGKCLSVFPLFCVCVLAPRVGLSQLVVLMQCPMKLILLAGTLSPTLGRLPYRSVLECLPAYGTKSAYPHVRD